MLCTRTIDFRASVLCEWNQCITVCANSRPFVWMEKSATHWCLRCAVHGRYASAVIPLDSHKRKICTGIANNKKKHPPTTLSGLFLLPFLFFSLLPSEALLSQLNTKTPIHMTKIWSHELFYVEKYHVLVSRIRMSVNQAAPIRLLEFFKENIYVKS